VPEVIVFPDVEQLLIDELKPALAARGWAVTVSSRVPSTRPAEFVRLMRTGGVRRGLVLDDAQVTVEAWAKSESRAVELAQLCRGLLPTFDPVYGVAEFSAPANLPDPTTAQVRYTATYRVTVRGYAA
jgi:hypothetical protein